MWLNQSRTAVAFTATAVLVDSDYYEFTADLLQFPYGRVCNYVTDAGAVQGKLRYSTYNCRPQILHR